MEITESGISIEVKLLQYSNALSPIEVTVTGITTEVKLLQRLNAPYEILSPVIVTFFNEYGM